MTACRNRVPAIRGPPGQHTFGDRSLWLLCPLYSCSMRGTASGCSAPTRLDRRFFSLDEKPSSMAREIARRRRVMSLRLSPWAASCLRYVKPDHLTIYGQEFDQPSPLLVAQARNEFGERVEVRLVRQFPVASATGSATGGIVRRTLFACTGYNGSLTGLQPGGWRFDPARLHLTPFIASSYVMKNLRRISI